MREAIANIPTAAHILGGAAVAKEVTSGGVDVRCLVFGDRNLIVGDGAAMPANPGVNPSLTIAALAEHAMTHVAAAGSLQGNAGRG